MNSSPSIKELAAALAHAQASFKAADKTARNPHFNARYAPLASVIEAYREPLSANGLALVQLTVPTDAQEVTVETVLLHSSGEWISSMLTLPADKATPQGFGSALTYARRYGASAMLNIAPDEDDDGNEAARAVAQRAVPTPQKPSPRGDVAPPRAPPPTPASTPVETFERIKSDLAATVAGPEGHEARLRIAVRVTGMQKAKVLTVEQTKDLQELYGRLERGDAHQAQPVGVATGPGKVEAVP